MFSGNSIVGELFNSNRAPFILRYLSLYLPPLFLIFSLWIIEVEVNYEQLRPSTTNTNSTNITESQQQFETIRIVYMNETGAIPEICVYRVNT